MSAPSNATSSADAPTRRPLPWVPVLLVTALVSYTVVRLQGLGDGLPYDPGPPLPTVDVQAGAVGETLDRLRQAFLDGRSARVIGEPTRQYPCWPLAGIERERALRVLAAMRAQQPGPLCDAVTAGIEAGDAFVLEEELFSARAADDWRDWSHELFHQGGRRRLLVVPIDLRRHPRAR